MTLTETFVIERHPELYEQALRSLATKRRRRPSKSDNEPIIWVYDTAPRTPGETITGVEELRRSIDERKSGRPRPTVEEQLAYELSNTMTYLRVTQGRRIERFPLEANPPEVEQNIRWHIEQNEVIHQRQMSAAPPSFWLAIDEEVLPILIEMTT